MNLYTPHFIWNTATDFYNLGFERCKVIFTENYKEDKYLYLKLAAPAINIALAAELFLKGILLHEEGTFEEIHSLEMLFSRLSESSKREIFELFNSDESFDDKFPSFKILNSTIATIESDSNINTLSPTEKMMCQLSIHDKSFINWRYLFDISKKNDRIRQFDFHFMVRFGYCCHRYIKKLQKTGIVTE